MLSDGKKGFWMGSIPQPFEFASKGVFISLLIKGTSHKSDPIV